MSDVGVLSSMRETAKNASSRAASDAVAEPGEEYAFVPPPGLEESAPANTPAKRESNEARQKAKRADHRAPEPAKGGNEFQRTEEEAGAADGAVAEKAAGGADDDFLIDPLPAAAPKDRGLAHLFGRRDGARAGAGAGGAAPEREAPAGALNKKKAMVAGALVIAMLVGLKVMTGGPTAPVPTPPEATEPAPAADPGLPAAVATGNEPTGDATATWQPVKKPTKLEAFSVPPLGDTARMAPELLSGAERERELTERILSGGATSPATPADGPAALAGAEQEKTAAPEPSPAQKLASAMEELRTGNEKLAASLGETNARIEALAKELAELKTARAQAGKTAVKAAEKPRLKLKAITRTPGCASCRPYALMEGKGGTRQVGSGDTVEGYAVSVDEDRVILTRGKTQHSYYLHDGF